MWTGGNATTSYAVLVVNLDTGVTLRDGSSYNAGEEAIQAMREITFQDGSPILRVKPFDDRSEAENQLRKRKAAALIIIPADFSQVILHSQDQESHPATDVELVGDLTNPYYTVAAVMAYTALDSYTLNATGEYRPIGMIETALGDSAARTEFELYVPGLFILAVIMVMFQASMMVAREIEGGKLQRLQITRVTSFELLGGISTWLVIISVLEILLTFCVATALGFRSHGALWIAILIGVITSFSVIGVGMIVASFSKTVSQAFVIANFPFGFFMFLSGAAFPVMTGAMFSMGGYDFHLVDLLPPTQAVVALNKIFTLGAGLNDVWFELTTLVVLSLSYFGLGVWLFRRMHLQ
jgi:ABC-2 type transport system permease protein